MLPSDLLAVAVETDPIQHLPHPAVQGMPPLHPSREPSTYKQAPSGPGPLNATPNYRMRTLPNPYVYALGEDSIHGLISLFFPSHPRISP